MAKSKSGLKSGWDAVAWPYTVLSCLKTLRWGWIKTILQRRVGQNSSTAMWKTHCQLLQTLVCSCCCKWWHNPVIRFRGNYFFMQGQAGLVGFFRKTEIWIYSGYLCVILKLVWWSESFMSDKYNKKHTGRGRNPFHTTVCMYVCIYIIYIYIYIYVNRFVSLLLSPV